MCHHGTYVITVVTGRELVHPNPHPKTTSFKVSRKREWWQDNNIVQKQQLTQCCIPKMAVSPTMTIFYLMSSSLLIGATLSEPHTSVTALLDACVCLCVTIKIPKI